MDLTTDLTGSDGPVVHLIGEIDLAGTDDVLAAGASALEVAPDGGRMVVDLSRVTFLDSAAMSAFVQLRAAALERAVRLVLRGATGPALRVLHLTGLDTVFEFEA